MDFKSAFLNDDFREDIYMQQPLGFIPTETSSLVCKLNKSLYGLKHSPTVWYQKIDTYLLKNGLKWCVSNTNMYVNKIDDDVLIIVLYVDYILIINIQLTLIQEMKNNLKNEIEMTNLGLLHYFLGL